LHFTGSDDEEMTVFQVSEKIVNIGRKFSRLEFGQWETPSVSDLTNAKKKLRRKANIYWSPRKVTNKLTEYFVLFGLCT
jgi:hypothetical protein